MKSHQRLTKNPKILHHLRICKDIQGIEGAATQVMHLHTGISEQKKI